MRVADVDIAGHIGGVGDLQVVELGGILRGGGAGAARRQGCGQREAGQ